MTGHVRIELAELEQGSQPDENGSVTSEQRSVTWLVWIQIVGMLCEGWGDVQQRHEERA